MGMILGGALAGGAAGAEKSVENSLAQMRQEGLIRLREQYENTRQQTQIEAGKAQQERGFGEEEKMHGVEHGEAVAAAGATRTFQEAQETKKEAAAQKRTETTAQSRRDVATIRGDSQKAAAGTKPPQPLLKHAGDYTLGGGIDPVTKQPTPQTKIPVYQHQDGRVFVMAGNRIMPFDSTTGKLPDAKSVGRGNAKAEQDLMGDPLGTTPNGQTKFDAFLDAYGYVPNGFFGAQQRAQSQGPTGGGPLKTPAVAGAKWTPAPGSNEVNTENEVEDARMDTEDAEAEGRETEADTTPAGGPGQ